jgi:hypothetical protein
MSSVAKGLKGLNIPASGKTTEKNSWVKEHKHAGGIVIF